MESRIPDANVQGLPHATDIPNQIIEPELAYSVQSQCTLPGSPHSQGADATRDGERLQANDDALSGKANENTTEGYSMHSVLPQSDTQNSLGANHAVRVSQVGRVSIKSTLSCMTNNVLAGLSLKNNGTGLSSQSSGSTLSPHDRAASGLLSMDTLHRFGSVIANSLPTLESCDELHPLVANAPDAICDIKFVRLAYFEQLLAAIGEEGDTLLPRCQEVPQEAFGRLKANSMLASISHGWFFQTHPDPFGDKRFQLLEIIRNLKTRYPLADVLIFLDFLSMTQRPYMAGQEPRTAEEQAGFDRSLTQMHNCYCYSDVVIHLHSAPPLDETEMGFTNVDMGQVEVAQVGSHVQVVGFRSELVSCHSGLGLFDTICTVDNVAITNVEQVLCQTGLVHYSKRPFGMMNTTPLQERGWVYLERFITMLKMAMMEAENIDNGMVTNSHSTRKILEDGAHSLREAAKGGNHVLMTTLRKFKEELKAKQFSAASTDKHMLERQTSPGGTLRLAANTDAAIVSDLMTEIMDSFGGNWQQEQEKQRIMAVRFKADVPLLLLTPLPWWDALMSWQSVSVTVVIVFALLCGGLAATAWASVTANMNAEELAFVMTTFLAVFFSIAANLISWQSELGVPLRRIFLANLPAILVCGLAASITGFVMPLDSRWCQRQWHVVILECSLFTLSISLKVGDVFNFYSSPHIKDSLKIKKRRLPGFRAKLFKGLWLGLVPSVAVGGCLAFLVACVQLRSVVNSLSPLAGCGVVLSMSVCKQLAMGTIASIVLPMSKANFAATDVICFMTGALLSFGTRILVTALNGSVVIFATSFITCTMELGFSVCILHHSFCRVQKLEAMTQRTQTASEPRTGDTEETRLRLWRARRQMSTEIILVINELFLEFFTSSATVAFGIAFSEPGPLSARLSSDLSWDMVPLFAATTYVPEILDSFLVVVYLRHVGVDWFGLCKAMLVDRRFLLVKMIGLFLSLCGLMLAGIDTQ